MFRVAVEMWLYNANLIFLHTRLPLVPVLRYGFYFSECDVTINYVDQSPDDAAEIIACVTDVNSEIAITLVYDWHSQTLASLTGHLELFLLLFQSGP